MLNRRQWSLGAKLGLVATPFLLLALLAISVTLWVSWQLDGGAAAVNEAGRMRMQQKRRGHQAKFRAKTPLSTIEHRASLGSFLRWHLI